LRAGKEVGHGGGQQVRRAVPIERQRFGAAIGHDAHRRILLDRKRQIDKLAVNDTGERRFREPCRDLGCDGAHGRPGSDSAIRSMLEA
jgi:hypothetical protein